MNVVGRQRFRNRQAQLALACFGGLLLLIGLSGWVQGDVISGGLWTVAHVRCPTDDGALGSASAEAAGAVDVDNQRPRVTPRTRCARSRFR